MRMWDQRLKYHWIWAHGWGKDEWRNHQRSWLNSSRVSKVGYKYRQKWVSLLNRWILLLLCIVGCIHHSPGHFHRHILQTEIECHLHRITHTLLSQREPCLVENRMTDRRDFHLERDEWQPAKNRSDKRAVQIQSKWDSFSDRINTSRFLSLQTD